MRFFLLADLLPDLLVHLRSVLGVVGELMPEDLANVVEEPRHGECNLSGLVGFLHVGLP